MMKWILTPALVALAACANTEVADDVENNIDVGDDPVVTTGACPVRFGADWDAWVDAEPPGPRTLIVTGQVLAPTPGYTASWRVGAADRMMPPGQHLHLEFAPPDGMVAQVITEMDVRYEGDATYPEYRVVFVHCGDDQTAEISPVLVAQ